MPQSTLARFAPLTGIAFVVLVVVAIIVGGEPQEIEDTSEEVAGWWADNDSQNIVSALLAALAAASLVWFGGSVRATLRSVERDPGRVAAIAFGGFVIAGLGFTTFAGFQFAAAETAGDVPAEVTHTLAVLGELFFFPFAIGVFVAFLATGIGILRHGGLARWLGYAAVVIAIGVLIPPPVAFVAFIAAGLWILTVAAVLFGDEGRRAAE